MLKSDLANNKLLSALPEPDLDLLFSKASVTAFDGGTILCEENFEVERVYFPIDGIISLLLIMKAGKAIEISTIGRNGVFGAMAGLGLHTSYVRAIAQVHTRVVHVSAATWRSLVENRQCFRDLSVRYNEMLLTQARVSVACNALHQLEARFCRKLLEISEMAPLAELTFTQKQLSQMLGVRRTSVNEVASKLQEAGIITYSRGHIRIIDRARLKSNSCECYETLVQRALL